MVKVWCEEFKLARHTDYFASPKDRKAMGLLLTKFKKKNSDINGEDMCEKIRGYFKEALRIQDSWYAKNMTLSVLDSHINKINQYILEYRRVTKQIKEADEIREGLKALEGVVKEVLWQPKTDEKRKRPYMSRVEFLRQYGSARINEYEDYKNNMEMKG